MTCAPGPNELFPNGCYIGAYKIEGLLVQPTTCSYVFSCTNMDDGGKYVFKYIRPTMSAKQVFNEIEMNQTLQHCPNVVIGFDFVEVYGSFGYFMDRYTGDLLDFVRCNTLQEENVKNMSFRILEALQYMHAAGFVHRDLKLENILLNGQGGEPDTYLADFGLSTKRVAGEYLTQPVGTRAYLAPELLQRPCQYTEAVDMWAFGVTIYAMLTGKMPFPDANKDWTGFIYAISSGVYNENLLTECGCSDVVCDLVHKLLCADPVMRLTSSEAMRHPFYKSLVDIEEGIKNNVSLFDEILHLQDDYTDF